MLKGINQLHGKTIEDMIKSTFQGSSDCSRSTSSRFDIEAIFDKELHLNTSIKASKKDNIELADARRFFENKDEFRLLICRYQQKGKMKIFTEIHEVLIDKHILDYLKGEMPYESIVDFHEKLKSFPAGKHAEARIFAKEHKQVLQNTYSSNIILNPKIDSKSQRRLQCSMNINHLYSAFPDSYTIHKENYKVLGLPISIFSEARKFNKTGNDNDF
jgi:hypothetical protein